MREDIPLFANALLARLTRGTSARLLPETVEALEKARFNRTAAAKLLGIAFRAMRYRTDRLGINQTGS